MSDPRTRVLFVSNNLAEGGAERFVSTAINHLDRERFEPMLCLFRRRLGYPLTDDVPVTVIDKRLEHRHWHLPGMILRTARLLDELRPDVVVTAYSYPSFVVGNAVALSRARPRWIARLSNNPVEEESGFRRLWLGRLYRRPDLFVANSRGLIEAYHAAYPHLKGRIEHFPNPADFHHIDAEAAQPLPPEGRDAPTLIAVGRLAPQKRIDLMIRAVAKVRKHEPVRLVLCGDGAERTSLERSAAALGLGDDVFFAGFCRNPFQRVARADLFVLSSDYEGSPNALIEAQGLGVAAVATDCPFGPSEIVEPGVTGLLVAPGDAEALAEAITGLLRDPGRRRAMGAAGRQRARRLFSADVVGRELETLLQRVAGGGI